MRRSTRRKRASRRAIARRTCNPSGWREERRARPAVRISGDPMSPVVKTETVPQAYLAVNNIEVIYDHVILVLRGVSLEVAEGRVVALLGANGAGKTTTLKAISNLLGAERGDVTKGTIEFRGTRVDKLTPNALVRMGV